MSSLPPSRYRIVERGRRLVTIDSITGAEIGLGATLANVGLEGHRRTMTAAAAAMPAAATQLALQTTDTPARPARAASALRPASLTSAPDLRPDRSPAPSGLDPGTAAALTPQNKPKVIALIIAAFIAVVLLLATGTWPIPVILLLIPQTRQWLVSLASSAVRRALGQDANG